MCAVGDRGRAKRERFPNLNHTHTINHNGIFIFNLNTNINIIININININIMINIIIRFFRFFKKAYGFFVIGRKLFLFWSASFFSIHTLGLASGEIAFPIPIQVAADKGKGHSGNRRETDGKDAIPII